MEGIASEDVSEFGRAYRHLSRCTNNVNKFLRTPPSNDNEIAVFNESKADFERYLKAYSSDHRPLFKIFTLAEVDMEPLLPIFGSTCAAILQLAAPLGQADVALSLARVLLRDGVADIQRALLCRKPFVVSPFLRMLTSLTALGQAPTAELFQAIDFTASQFMGFFKVTSKPEIKKTESRLHLSLRELFIYFLLSSLRSATPAVKQILCKIFPQMFIGLKGDGAEIVTAVSQQLFANLVADPLVSKSTLVQLFNVVSLKHVLTALATLKDTRALASLEEFIWQVCGIGKGKKLDITGIRFADNGWYGCHASSQTLRNPNLSSLLTNHTQLTSCEIHCNFALGLLAECCELRPVVWQNSALNFHTTEPDVCIASLAFWAQLLELPLPALKASEPPSTELALLCLIPPAIQQLSVQKGVQHSDATMVLAWLKCMRLLCERLEDIGATLVRQLDHASSQVLQSFRVWKMALDAGVYKVMVNQQVLFSVAQKWRQHILANESRNLLADAIVVEALALFALLRKIFPEFSLEPNAIEAGNFLRWESLGDDACFTDRLEEPFKFYAKSYLSTLTGSSAEEPAVVEKHGTNDSVVGPSEEFATLLRPSLPKVVKILLALRKGREAPENAQRVKLLYDATRDPADMIATFSQASQPEERGHFVLKLGTLVLKHWFECHWMVEFLTVLVRELLEPKSKVSQTLLMLYENHSKSAKYYDMLSVEGIEMLAMPKCGGVDAFEDLESGMESNFGTIQAAHARLIAELVASNPGELATPSLLSKMFTEYTATGSKKDSALFRLLTFAHVEARWDTGELVSQQALRCSKAFGGNPIVTQAVRRHLSNKASESVYSPFFVRVGFLSFCDRPLPPFSPKFVLPLLVEAMNESINLENRIDSEGNLSVCDWTPFFEWALKVGLFEQVISGLAEEGDRSIRLQSVFVLKFLMERLECCVNLSEQSSAMQLLCRFYFALEFEDEDASPKLVPGVWVQFVGLCVNIVRHPGHWLYERVQLLLERSNTFDLYTETPFTSAFLFSASDTGLAKANGGNFLQGHREQLWMFKLLCQGYKNSADAELYKRYHVLELLVSVYESKMLPGDSAQSFKLLEDLLAKQRSIIPVSVMESYRALF